MDIETFPVFDAHLHFPLAFLDQSAAIFRRCGIQGGINLWCGAFAKVTWENDARLLSQ